LISCLRSSPSFVAQHRLKRVFHGSIICSALLLSRLLCLMSCLLVMQSISVLMQMVKTKERTSSIDIRAWIEDGDGMCSWNAVWVRCYGASISSHIWSMPRFDSASAFVEIHGRSSRWWSLRLVLGSLLVISHSHCFSWNLVGDNHGD